jgi:HSP90 family molecular chaperone
LNGPVYAGGSRSGDSARNAKEQASAEYAALISQLKAILAGQAWDVRVSSRLTTSPACIVAGEQDIDPGLRLRSYGMPTKPVLEINPQHPLVRRLNSEPNDPQPIALHQLRNPGTRTASVPEARGGRGSGETLRVRRLG